MSISSAGVRASIAAVGAALAASAAALDPLEFVAGWPIEAPADAKVFDVPLTAEVYAAANGIEQLAVLDANGEPQPFFRRSPPPTPPTEQRVVLEASPLYAGSAGGGPSVGVTTSARGTSVTVTPGAPSDPRSRGFVLDARAVTTAPIALDLDWRALPQPFLLEVSVEQSTDLTNWRGVGRGSVAELAIGDAAGAARARAGASRRRWLSARHAEQRRRGLALAARGARELDDRAGGACARSRAAARGAARAPRSRCRMRSTSMRAARCRSRPWRWVSPRATAGLARRSRRAARWTDPGRPSRTASSFIRCRSKAANSRARP